jgi:KinB signaling pathway activation protein
LILIISGFVVAYFKSKTTNYSAFLPTFFFMNIGSLLALIPVWSYEAAMLFILPAVLVCNAWQIMQLHQIVGKPADKQTQSN